MTDRELAASIEAEYYWLVGFAHAIMDHSPVAGAHLLEHLAFKRKDCESDLLAAIDELYSRGYPND